MSGRTENKGMNVSYRPTIMDSICNPCSRRNCVSKLTHWCSDCEDGLCEKCFNDHKVMKMTQRHRVVDISEIPTANLKLLSIPQCERHPDCREDFRCLDHDVICCHACITSDHKDCKNVSNVNVLSKGASKSELFIANMKTLQEVRDSMYKIKEERQSAIKDVTKQRQKIKMEIANTKSKFMEHINKLEKVLIHELTNIEKDNRILIEEETTDIMKTVKEIEEDANTLQFVTDHGSESQLFTLLTKRRKKHENILKILTEIPPTARTNIGFEEACHEIKAIKALGFLSVHYEIVESKGSGVRVNEYEDAVLSASDERKQTTTPSTGNIHKFQLKETSQIQLDPKDFVEKNETYAKWNLKKVWITASDDNCLLVAGHVIIQDEQSEKKKTSKYKNNYRVVKYIFIDKGLTLSNDFNIYCQDYSESSFESPSMKMALSCIPNSKLAVLLYDKKLNLIDTDAMKIQWCFTFIHDFNAIATDEMFIYITHDCTLYKYNRIGCFMGSMEFLRCDSVASTLNSSNFACLCSKLPWLKSDCSEIFSYEFPINVRTVSVDNASNIYLTTSSGIQILDPLRMETEIVYKFDKNKKGWLNEVVCNRDTMTLFFLRTESQMEEKFGHYGHGHRDISQHTQYDENRSLRYVCPGCTYKTTDKYCVYCAAGFHDRSVSFSECLSLNEIRHIE